jgi:hypothetical protein
MRIINTFFLYVIIVIALFGCSLQPEEIMDEHENVMIFSGDDSLVIDMESAVMLEYESISRGIPGVRAPVKDFDYTITQICQIKPTTVNGHAVQANDIIMSGITTYVAYNTAGPVFDGAIQIIKKFGRKIFLFREIQFADMDIICLSLHGNKLLFGGMANPDVFEGKRSFVGEIDLFRLYARDIKESIVYLSSYAATGIAFSDDKYYVSVGAADGGIHILDRDLAPVSGTLDTPDILADDIRDIEAYESGVIALAGTAGAGTSGRILIIKDETLSRDIEITDFNSPEAKATIDVRGNYAYLGLSAKGFQVFDLNAESEVLTFANPDDDPLHVTNSISYDNNLIFSANGEYGFRVLDCIPASGEVDVIGFYSFTGLTDPLGQNYSANHITFRNQYFYVAAGTGGLLVYDLTDK